MEFRCKKLKQISIICVFKSTVFNNWEDAGLSDLHRSNKTHDGAVCIRKKLSKLGEQVLLVLKESGNLCVDLLFS